MNTNFFATARRVLTTAGLGACLAACGGNDSAANEPAPMPSSGSEQATTGTEAIGDAQIAAILNTVNTGELAQAQLAQQRATDPSVRQFAEHMMTDHTATAGRLTAVLQSEQIVPADNSVSMRIQSDADALMAQLQQANGAEFDRLYMQAQVRQHDEVVRMLDQQLIPAAQDMEYRAFLQQLRGDLAGHLAHAQQVDASLTGGAQAARR